MYQQTRALSGGGFSCYIFFSINIAGAAEKCLGEKGKIFFFLKRGLRWVVSRVSQQQLKKKRGKSTHCANNKKSDTFLQRITPFKIHCCNGKKVPYFTSIAFEVREDRKGEEGWMNGWRQRKKGQHWGDPEVFMRQLLSYSQGFPADISLFLIRLTLP